MPSRLTLRSLIIATSIFAACAKSNSPSSQTDAGNNVDLNADGSQQTLYPCDTPGIACDAKDPCAINPICGEDRLCRPQDIQVCDDHLECTHDTCSTEQQGKCVYEPIAGTCILSVQTATGSKPTCFAQGEALPDNPCFECNPQLSSNMPSPKNGGSCDDGDPCTHSDYCNSGTCAGTDYRADCSDTLACTSTLCDGKGGCLQNPVMTTNCLIEGVCYQQGDKGINGCAICDPSQDITEWTLTVLPDCAGRECGPDPQCGIECGTCNPTEHCDAAGKCQLGVSASWSASTPIANIAWLYDVWGSAENNVWAVGWDGTPTTTAADGGVLLHFDGTGWKQQTLPSGVKLLESIWGSSASDIWAGGIFDDKAGLLHFDGATWKFVKSLGSTYQISTKIYSIKDIWGNSQKDVWAIANVDTTFEKVLIHFDGSAWKQVTGFPDPNIHAIAEIQAVWASSANNVWMVGWGLLAADPSLKAWLIHYDATQWKTLTAPKPAYFMNGIWGSAANNIWAVGSNVAMSEGIITHYDGNAWSLVTSPNTVSELNSVWGNTANDVWAVGVDTNQHGAIVHFNGSSWTHVQDTQYLKEMSSIWGSAENNVWAVGEGGMIAHYK